jgi:hypothetical protein
MRCSLVSTISFRLSGTGAAVLVAVYQCLGWWSSTGNPRNGGQLDRLAIESSEDAKEYLAAAADLGEADMRIRGHSRSPCLVR